MMLLVIDSLVMNIQGVDWNSLVSDMYLKLLGSLVTHRPFYE
jgi:hypothetical protein